MRALEARSRRRSRHLHAVTVSSAHVRLARGKPPSRSHQLALRRSQGSVVSFAAGVSVVRAHIRVPTEQLYAYHTVVHTLV